MELSDLLSSSLLSSSDPLATALISQKDQKKALANSALSRAITLTQEKKYEQAIREYKLATAYNPQLTEAYQYMGNTYKRLGKYDEAIEAYKKPVSLDPSSIDDVINLANAYIEAGRNDEAETTLKGAVKLNPLSPNAFNILGHLYLKTGRNDEAELEFKKVIDLVPTDGNGYYGLGLAYNKQEKYTAAVDQFETAIQLKDDFAFAHADLGLAYIGLGKTEKAQEQVDILWDMNTSESKALSAELEISLFTPKIVDIDTADSTFIASLGPATPLYFLDASLSSPNASKTFSVTIQFNQPMDIASAQNTFNWSISKAKGGIGGWYNNGITLHPESEIAIPPILKSVYYDVKNYKATLFFSISQNSTATGITDPSHWVFKFAGTDVSGNAMDPKGDEYDGFAGTSF